MKKTIKDAVGVEDVAEAELISSTALATAKPKAHWEYKTEFRVNTEMKKVIDLTIKVSEAEIESLKRKLDKLTYGA